MTNVERKQLKTAIENAEKDFADRHAKALEAATAKNYEAAAAQIDICKNRLIQIIALNDVLKTMKVTKR